MFVDSSYKPKLLSSIPAHWNDDLLFVCPNYRHILGSPKKFGARILSLGINATVFPLLLAIDTIHFSAKAVWYKGRSIIPIQHNTNPEYKQYVQIVNDTALKCIRSMFAWALGLIFPDIITNHFLIRPAPDGRIHPKGNLYTASAAEIHRPESEKDVADIVIKTIANKQKVSIAGAGFSQGKHTLPNRSADVHIDMKKICHVNIDPATRIATIGGGATWKQIQEEAEKYQLAVQVMQASNVFSIGGSLSVNCHGWDHKMGALANTVKSITIVNAQGEINKILPSHDLFRYVVGGYGLFGVIVEVELELTDNQLLLDRGTYVAIEDYPEYFQKIIKSNPHVAMHLYRLCLIPGRLLEKGYAQNYFMATDAIRSENVQDEPIRGTTLDKIMMNFARNSRFVRRFYWNTIEKDLKTTKEATRNEIMRPPIIAAYENSSKAHSEWLQEYFVSKEELVPFIKFLGGVLNKNSVTLLNASVRYVIKDEKAELGYAADGDRFAIVLFFTQSLNKEEIEKTRTWVREVVNYLEKHNGTFYLPYAHLASKEQFQKCYPRWENVKKAKVKYDPNGVFDNGLYQDYFQ